MDIGIYNLGFLYLLKQELPKSFTSEVRMNEYGTDEYSDISFAYSDGCVAQSVQTIGKELERNATITGLLDDIRSSWGMQFQGEEC